MSRLTIHRPATAGRSADGAPVWRPVARRGIILGVTDEEGSAEPKGRVALPALRQLLVDQGIDRTTIARAEAAGVLGFYAIERLAMPEPILYDLDEIVEVTGMPADQITLIWRSLGLPEPRKGFRIFTEGDADMIRTVAGLIEVGLIEPDLAVQMSRVIGWSLARVAAAMVDSIETDPAGRTSEDTDLALFAGTMLPTLTEVIERVWRRHLQMEARRRIVRELDPTEQREERAVGFADLVGFTTLSQQVDDHTLAGIVGRFETIAYETVLRLGGRVVKMIGDEVMFVVNDPRRAVRIGLALAEEYAADEALSDVRVGIAYGPVLEREADLYGPVVNLASRIVNIAFPGSVITSDEVRHAVGDLPDLAWKSLKPRRIKDIGRVPLWAVRDASDDDRSGPRSIVRERRTEARERRLATLEADGRRRRGQDPDPAP